MKFTIVGAGAIGGVIGAYLAKGGREVTLVDAAEDHVRAMQQKGLKIIAQNEPFTVPVKACTVDEYLAGGEKPECILLCVKAQHTEAALRPFLPLLIEDSFVISVQNGLCELEIKNLVGEERTVCGFVNIFADYLEPGVVEYGGKGALCLGELDGRISSRLKQLEQEMSVLDRLEISDDVFGYLWGKLAYGAILTATALTNEQMADIFANPRYRNLLMDIAAEVLAVADYAGVQPKPFDDWNPADAYPRQARDQAKMNAQLDIHVQRLRGYTKVYSGIWRDIAVRKRKTEKPYHFKPVFALAEQAGIEMPLCHLLLELLHELEEGRRPFSLDNLEILLDKNRQLGNAKSGG